ncbi:MAG: bis(5'-nucleosyl)-tetraphosphatase [Candidatus Howiella sp.]|jgi:bis(5'-nucleosidyl)-tetraphosphatase
MQFVKREKSCGAVVFRLTSGKIEVLLINHVNGGHWAFPKGHVEGVESEEETALREILEETGLTVRLDTGFRQSVVYSPAAGVEKEVVYFAAFADESRPVRQECEVNEIRFLPVQAALKQITYANDRKILAAAADYLSRKNFN